MPTATPTPTATAAATPNRNTLTDEHGCRDCDSDTDAYAEHGAPGDVVINEILQNPAAVADTAGEWFEVYNATSRPST